MSKRPWFCEMGVRARKMLSVLLALELCVAGVPVTAFAEEGVDDQEVLAQADGAIVSVEQNTEGEEPELLEGHLYLYQSAESPYFDDGELRTQSVTPGLEDKLTDEECERIKSAIVQVADLADSNYYVSLTNCELNYDEVQAIIMDVINSHPEYWYVNSTFTYVETSPGSDIIQRFYLQYLASGSKLDAMKAKYNQNMSDLLSWIPKNATVEQKVKVVHDWLVRNAAYDEPAGSIHKSEDVKKYREETGRDPWSAYGAMVEHQPVCQGYSLAFLSAMCHLGIEADVVGTATHQWNRVKINDTWYHVDVTWDDPVPDQGFNINPMPTWYFLKSDGGVAAEDDQSHIVHKDWQLAKPVCPDTSYDGKTDWATYTGPAGDKVPVTALTITVPDGPGDDGVYPYTGSRIKPKLTVTYNGTALVEGTDYTLDYGENTLPQTGTVVVTCQGDYEGSITREFSIVGSWTRYAGDTALDTGKQVVEADNGSVFEAGRGGTVIVATNDGYWDALAAAGLAGAKDAPVLITNKKNLSQQTREEIIRLAPEHVYVAGGTAAVSNDVFDQIKQLVPDTSRVYGETATDTAVAIYATNLGGWSSTAIVATSSGYWDALSIAPYAWWSHSPILLTGSNKKLDATALRAIKTGGFTRVVIVGGIGAVSSQVEDQIKNEAGVDNVFRLSGDTALDTSARIAEWEIGEGMGMTHLSVATSDGYWDALTGAAVCGKTESVLVLAGKDKQKNPWRAFDALQGKGAIGHGHVLGGESAVSPAAWDHFTGGDKK